MHLRRIAAALFGIALCAPAMGGIIVEPTDADIDESFGSTVPSPGWRRMFFSSSDERAVGFARTLDGGYVVAIERPGGAQGKALGLVRLTRDGGVVTGFGNAGRVSLDPGFITIAAMTVDAQDRIVVVGETPGNAGLSDIGVMRATPAGVLDPGFDGDGIASFTFGTNDFNSNDMPTAVLAQADGRIVVAGNAGFSGNPSQFSLLRVDVDGSLDDTFGIISDGAGGVRGTVGTFFSSQAAYASSVLQMTDGYLLLVGTTVVSDFNLDFAARIITPSGQIWPGNAGSLALPIDEPGGGTSRYDVATAAARVDGRTAVVVGNANGRAAARRLRFGPPNQAGVFTTLEIDTTFTGSQIPDRPARYVSATPYAVNDVAIRADGSVMLVGGLTTFEGADVGVVERLAPDGSHDDTFDNGPDVSTYTAPVSAGGDSYSTGFVRVLVDDSRPVLLGTSADNTGAALDDDAVATRLASRQVTLPPLFEDGFEAPSN